MSVPIRRHLGTLIVITVLAAGVGLILYTRAGAAPDGDNDTPSSLASLPPLHAPPNPAAIVLLPKDHVLVTAGALTIATTPSALPLSDYAADGKQVIGVEPDIAKLVADALGLRLNLVPVAWPDWPLGLESGKYDAVMSNITVTESRKRKFDVSSYRYDLLGIYTRTGGPVRAVTQPRDVAGLKVIVGTSTNQDQILRRWDAQNVAAGLPPVEFQYIDDPVIGRLAVMTGRADISFQPNATGAYAARDGTVHQIGLFPGGWPDTAAISVATRKGSGLAAAITQSLNAQIDNGNYAAALARWNLQSEAVPRSQTNPPGLADL